MEAVQSFSFWLGTLHLSFTPALPPSLKLLHSGENCSKLDRRGGEFPTSQWGYASSYRAIQTYCV